MSTRPSPAAAAPVTQAPPVDRPVATRTPDPRSWPTAARAAAGVVLVASPVLSAVAAVTVPSFDERSERLARVAASPSPYELAHAVQLASLPLAAAAVVLVTLLTFGRSPQLAVVSGVLGVVGVIGHAVVSGLEVMTDAVAAGGMDLPALVAVDAGLSSPPVIVAAVLFIPVSVVGYVLRGLALWRSRAVPGAVVVLFALWLPVDFVGVPYVGQVLGVAVGLALATVVVRRLPDRGTPAPSGVRG